MYERYHFFGPPCRSNSGLFRAAGPEKQKPCSSNLIIQERCRLCQSTLRRYLACRKPKLRGQITTNVTVRQTSNDCAQKVFRLCLNVATDDAVMTSAGGRLFHTRGAAAPNARSLIVRSRVRRTTSS